MCPVVVRVLERLREQIQSCTSLAVAASRERQCTSAPFPVCFFLIGSVHNGQRATVHELVPVSPIGEDSEDDELPDEDFSKLPSEWIAVHASQVNRMLIGGMHILGLAFPTIRVPDATGYERFGGCDFGLTDVAGLLGVLGSLSVPGCHEDFGPENRMFLMFENSKRAAGGNIAVRKISLSRKELDYCELKWIPFDQEYFRVLRTVVAIDETIMVSSASLEVEGAIRESLNPICERILLSVAVIRDETIPDSDLRSCDNVLASSPASVELYGSLLMNGGEGRIFDAQCSPVLELDEREISKDEDGRGPRRLRIIGSLLGVACVPEKHVIGLSVQELKYDVVRSLCSRVELLLGCSDGKLNLFGERGVCLPRRVLLRRRCQSDDLFNALLPFCDYLFPGEEVEQAEDRFASFLCIDRDKTEVLPLEEFAVAPKFRKGENSVVGEDKELSDEEHVSWKQKLLRILRKVVYPSLAAILVACVVQYIAQQRLGAP